MPTKQKKKDDVIGLSFIEQLKQDFKTKPVDELVTIAEAAKIRNVSPQAVLYILKTHKLRSETIGDKLMVYRSDVENYRPQKPGPKTETT